MNETITDLKETVAELTAVLLAEIHEKNELLVETQHHLLLQQQATRRAYDKLKKLEAQLGQ